MKKVNAKWFEDLEKGAEEFDAELDRVATKFDNNVREAAEKFDADLDDDD
ncbi:MAG: hypothetical protein WC389_21020 [Lutibacter sp.]